MINATRVKLMFAFVFVYLVCFLARYFVIVPLGYVKLFIIEMPEISDEDPEPVCWISYRITMRALAYTSSFLYFVVGLFLITIFVFLARAKQNAAN